MYNVIKRDGKQVAFDISKISQKMEEIYVAEFKISE